MIKDTIKNTASETIDIINKVDSFYNSAWEKLLIFGGIAGGILGVIVPLLIQFYQKALLKQSEKMLADKIEEETDKIKAELKLEMDKQIQLHFKEYDIKLKKIELTNLAMVLHKQANEIYNKGDFKLATVDYLKACANYIKAEKYGSIHGILKKITTCVSRLTIEDIEDLKIHKADISIFYNIIEKSSVYSVYVNDIITLKATIAKLPKRKNFQ